MSWNTHNHLHSRTQMTSNAHWHAFLYLYAQTYIKTFMYLLHFKSLKTWAKWAKWARILKNTLTDEQLCNTDICMLRQTKVHSFIDPTQNCKKSKKISFKFFINKSLKNHSAKNICRRAFCLAPNERELSNLLTLSISLEAPICLWRSITF